MGPIFGIFKTGFLCNLEIKNIGKNSYKLSPLHPFKNELNKVSATNPFLLNFLRLLMKESRGEDNFVSVASVQD